jgi:hypothetical protein
MGERKIKFWTHTKAVVIATILTLSVPLILNPLSQITLQNLSKADLSKAETNILLNPSFETAGSPIANWGTRVGLGSIATTSQDTIEKINGNYSAKIVVSQADNVTKNVQFRQRVALSANQPYTFSFYSKAAGNHTVSIDIVNASSTSTIYKEWSYGVTPTWQKYTFSYTPTNNLDAYINFNVGGVVKTVWMDDANLTTLTATTPPTIPSSTPTPRPTSTPTPKTSTPIPTTPSPRPTTIPTFQTSPPRSTPTPIPQQPTSPPTEPPQDETPEESSYQYTTDTTDTSTEPTYPFILDQTEVSSEVNRTSTRGGKMYGNGFTITSTGITLWSIHNTDNSTEYGFDPAVSIIKSGETNTVQSFVKTSKPNGIYTGEAILEYYYNNRWNTGPTISYIINVSGEQSQTITTTTSKKGISPQSTPTPNPTSTQTTYLKTTLTTPQDNARIVNSHTLNVKWNIDTNSTSKSITTTLALIKELGANKRTVAQVENIKSINGQNTYSWSQNVPPGAYKLQVKVHAGDKEEAIQEKQITLGSTLKIYAAGTAYNNIYPTMEILINNAVVKTVFGVQGNPSKRQFMEYKYDAPTQLTASQVKINFTNDETNGPDNKDRTLTIDKINLDGTDYETEKPTVYSQGGESTTNSCKVGFKKTETLICTGYFKY